MKPLTETGRHYEVAIWSLILVLVVNIVGVSFWAATLAANMSNMTIQVRILTDRVHDMETAVIRLKTIHEQEDKNGRRE